MSRKHLVLAILLAACGAASPAAAAQKLVWTYPCAFTWEDKTPAQVTVPGSTVTFTVAGFQCDFMRVQLRPPANEEFNDRQPTYEAQQNLLMGMIGGANAAIKSYLAVQKAVLEKTDPALIPKSLPPEARLRRLMELQAALNEAVVKSFGPFQWEKMEESSYVDKTTGGFPKSWGPYVFPYIARSKQLAELAAEGQKGAVDKANSDLDSRIRVQGPTAVAMTKAVEQFRKAGADAKSLLDKFFTGGGGSEVGVGPAGARPAAAPQAAVPARIPTLSAPKPAPPPPLPKGPEAVSRHYFNRGYAAGMTRLKDDAQISWQHYLGTSRTVGDPRGAARFIVHQVGPSCAVGAQYMALKVRGQDVAIDQLADEGRRKGYYTEFGTSSGARAGGTDMTKGGRLLADHGVSAKVVPHATLKQLDDALRKSGDAIVGLDAKIFWDSAKLPDRSGHAVYVSGAETDSSGKVLGYYFNDTGTGEGARFVTVKDFERAWKSMGSTLVIIK